jgi:formate-dependent nitrite reductase membrane component NrfD
MTPRELKYLEHSKTDGRDIDPNTGILTGEGSVQKASLSADAHLAGRGQTWTGLPEPHRHDPTYYDRPLLQESVWTWAVPVYYYTGGLAGASMVLAAALQARDEERFKDLIQRGHLFGFVGTVVSGVLLVYDLGRPARFLNMLRVFRPTSPMNMGAWILTAASGASAGAFLMRKTLLGRLMGLAGGIFGLGLATYTGVLVANSAVPVWQASRKALPILFGSSAMASAGSAFDILYDGAFGDSQVTRIFGNIGRAGELAASFAMERDASKVEYVGRPLRHGLSGAMWKTAALLTASSLVVSLVSKNKRARTAAGVLGTLGSLLMRFTVEHAGKVSARDPRATFRQQRF